MIEKLLKKVRKSYPKDIKEAAFELARTKDRRAVGEFKAMVFQGYSTWFFHYGLTEQLVGIEALGKTGSSEALFFLSRLYFSVRKKVQGDNCCVFFGNFDESDLYEHHKIESFEFPFAEEHLGKKLEYQIQTTKETDMQYKGLYARPREEIDIELRKVFNREEHRLIRGAIKELEQELGKKTKIITIDSTSFPWYIDTIGEENFFRSCYERRHSDPETSRYGPGSVVL